MELITQQMVLVILFLSSPKCRVQSKTAPFFQWGGEAGCALEGGWRRPSDCHPKELSKCWLRLEAMVFFLGGSPGFKGSARPFEGEYLQLISSVAQTTNQIK